MPSDERERSKPKQPAKVKDLSHVPCKFFKVGACTAGSSCPFSHILPEPGGHKEVCAWFVKGNCKFGHKCALAHVLPGQPMSMDRKNKKAAQVAANANNTANNIAPSPGKDPAKSSKAHKKDLKPAGVLDGTSSPARTNALLSGSTAPTRVLPSSARPPLPVPLKASISPSAPAPPLKDTDFAFGLPDEDTLLPIETKLATETLPDIERPTERSPLPPSSPLPLSTPRRLANLQGSPGPVDFGPIGSPPRSMASTGKLPRINGGSNGSPGTSPPFTHHHHHPSPFSAPGTQTVFDTSSADMHKSRSGIAASLGAHRSWMPDFTPVPAHAIARTHLLVDALDPDAAVAVAVEDEDLEDFLPSSLTDLLTVEERSRRMSRSNSGQRGITITRDASGQRGGAAAANNNLDGSHHRYSRSVPAPSLLSDIQSIWSDPVAPIPSDVHSNNNNASGGGLAVGSSSNSKLHALGTPSSFKSSHHAFGGRSFSNNALGNHNNNNGSSGTADDGFSPAVPPSNASAAFLPGLHHHYLSAKGGRGGGGGVVSGGGTTNVFATAAGMTLSPPHLHAMAGRGGVGVGEHHQQSSQQQQVLGGRPIPGNGAYGGGGGEGVGMGMDEMRSALSPSTRALQAHAPGQSLPQGLAAGLSRIHVQPLPVSSSTTKQVYASPGVSVGGQEWVVGGGEEGVRVVAPGMVRGASGGRGGWPGQVVFSPLSGPVLTGDDDDLFPMDG